MSGRNSARWWALVVVHNAVIHPLLPLAELCAVLGLRRIAEFVFWAHDRTVPDGAG